MGSSRQEYPVRGLNRLSLTKAGKKTGVYKDERKNEMEVWGEGFIKIGLTILQ